MIKYLEFDTIREVVNIQTIIANCSLELGYPPHADLTVHRTIINDKFLLIFNKNANHFGIQFLTSDEFSAIKECTEEYINADLRAQAEINVPVESDTKQIMVDWIRAKNVDMSMSNTKPELWAKVQELQA